MELIDCTASSCWNLATEEIFCEKKPWNCLCSVLQIIKCVVDDPPSVSSSRLKGQKGHCRDEYVEQEEMWAKFKTVDSLKISVGVLCTAWFNKLNDNCQSAELQSHCMLCGIVNNRELIVGSVSPEHVCPCGVNPSTSCACVACACAFA